MKTKNAILFFVCIVVSNACAMENDTNRSTGKDRHLTYEQLVEKNRELQEELVKVRIERKHQEEILNNRLEQIKKLLIEITTKAADAARSNNN